MRSLDNSNFCNKMGPKSPDYREQEGGLEHGDGGGRTECEADAISIALYGRSVTMGKEF